MNSGKKVQSKNQSKNDATNSARIIETLAIVLSYIVLIIFFPIAIFFCVTTVSEFQRIVIFRLGRLRSKGARGPGMIFYLPCVDQIFRVDLRTDSFDVPAQAILTRDSVTIKLDAIVYYRIEDPVKAIMNAISPNRATEYLAQTTLRNLTGETMLAELLASRDELSRSILREMEAATNLWGVKVERVEIKEITMPKQLQRAMAAEQEATRQAKAKIAAADGELQSSTALYEASQTMAQNPIALQLRYLQTLNTVAADQNHTVIVPFPLDIFRKIYGGGSNKEKSSGGQSNDLENQLNRITGKSIDDVADLSEFVTAQTTLSDVNDSFDGGENNRAYKNEKGTQMDDFL